MVIGDRGEKKPKKKKYPTIEVNYMTVGKGEN